MPTYCLTSCSSLVRARLCQPSGPGLIPGMSRSETAITRGNPIMQLPPTTFSCTPCLCANLLAGFLARDCHEGIQTCNLWVSVLIRSYRRAIVGGTPKFPGQLIALLLVAHWLERWCASLAAHDQFLACPVQRQLLQGETRSCCCRPPYFVYYMLRDKITYLM